MTLNAEVDEAGKNPAYMARPVPHASETSNTQPSLAQEEHHTRTPVLYMQVEDTIEREPGLTDQQKTMLKASAYDSYDMLVLTDEFVNQVCVYVCVCVCVCVCVRVRVRVCVIGEQVALYLLQSTQQCVYCGTPVGFMLAPSDFYALIICSV